MKSNASGLALPILLLCLGTASGQNPTASAAPSGVSWAQYSSPGAPPPMDPATGLPMLELPPWKDANWPDPNITLTNVFYDGLPLTEVANLLSHDFKDAFDILLPGGSGSAKVDLDNLAIRLRLKNVAASEIFNAMNAVFENDRRPLRWELKMNGNRPLALLRVLGDPMRPEPAPPAPELQRMVYFVGDLIGDEGSGGMTLDQVVGTIREVCQMTYGEGLNVQFHKQAQLLVATGSREMIQFVQQTLAALRQKADLERRLHAKPLETGPKTEPAKPGASSAPK